MQLSKNYKTFHCLIAVKQWLTDLSCDFKVCLV